MNKSFKTDLTALRAKYSFLSYRDCTPEDIEKIKQFQKEYHGFPEDVIMVNPPEGKNGEVLYRRRTKNVDDSTHEERIEYLLLKQTEHLNSIRKMLFFFVILSCTSLAVGLIFVFSTLLS